MADAVIRKACTNDIPLLGVAFYKIIITDKLETYYKFVIIYSFYRFRKWRDFVLLKRYVLNA